MLPYVITEKCLFPPKFCNIFCNFSDKQMIKSQFIDHMEHFC